jgi:hypothetical protein
MERTGSKGRMVGRMGKTVVLLEQQVQQVLVLESQCTVLQTKYSYMLHTVSGLKNQH